MFNLILDYRMYICKLTCTDTEQTCKYIFNISCVQHVYTAHFGTVFY